LHALSKFPNFMLQSNQIKYSHIHLITYVLFYQLYAFSLQIMLLVTEADIELMVLSKSSRILDDELRLFVAG